MLTKDMLLNNMICAYFIDNDRKNIEILCTSEDKKSVNATIIPYDENNSMFKTLMLVTTIDELHENTYKKKKEEKKIFEQKVIEIAKERELREILEEKLYNNFYNPKGKVAQTNIDLSALYDIHTEKDLSL